MTLDSLCFGFYVLKNLKISTYEIVYLSSKSILISKQMNSDQPLTSFENESFLIRLEGEILYAHIKQNVILDKEKAEEAYRIFEKMGIGPGKRNVFEIMSGLSWSSATKDSMHLAKDIGHEYFFAVAMIGNSLTQRMIVNFFNLIFDTGVPFKMFSNEQKAKEWLEIYM